jgi:hypothetical protein
MIKVFGFIFFPLETLGYIVGGIVAGFIILTIYFKRRD